MTKLASFLRPRLASRQNQTTDHPDANLLLAFAEGELSGPERAATLAHLADCPVCREVLSVSTGTAAGESPESVSSKASPVWWAWRLAASAAVICLIAVTVSRLPLFRSAPPNAPSFKPVTPIVPVPVAPVPPAPKIVQPEKPKPKALLKRAPTRLQPEPLPAIRPQSSEVSAPAASQDFLAPNSMFSAGSRAASIRMQRSSSEILWSLGEAAGRGAVRKSEDDGRTWRTISVDPAAPLYALSANGTDVWAGGSAGKLFHSPDGGLTWTPVPVADDNTSLSGTITGIDARAPNITLKTDSGATWISVDGGKTWHAEP